MTFKFSLSILAAAALLAGCAGFDQSVQSHISTQNVIAGAKVDRDEFRKVTSVMAGRLTDRSMPGTDCELWLEANRHDDASQINYFIVFKTVRADAWGWAFWGEAFDSSGRKLEVIKNGTDTGNGGLTYESILIHVSRAYLEGGTVSGLTFRVDGNRAQKVINYPPHHIEGFLAKVDQTFASNSMRHTP
jgi:hypothetical protein